MTGAKVGIVGSGMVGGTTAYSMLLNGVADEIVMVDCDRARSAAEASDIWHAVPWQHDARVRVGEIADLDGAAVVVFSAGVNSKPGETRLDLLGRNAAVVAETLPEIFRHAPDAVLLMTTNPVDVLTHLAIGIGRQIGIAPNQVIGSGTTLDSCRLRCELAAHFEVSPNSVDALVVGEHGDSQVSLFSSARIGGLSLDSYAKSTRCSWTPTDQEGIATSVRKAAYRIVQGKGATWFGIASCLSEIAGAVIRDKRRVMPVSIRCEELLGGEPAVLSLLSVIGRGGVSRSFVPEMSPAELEGLKTSQTAMANAALSLTKENLA